MHDVSPLLRAPGINFENSKAFVFANSDTQKRNATSFVNEILKLNFLPPEWEAKLVY